MEAKSKRSIFRIDEEKWPEAKNWGWGISSVEGYDSMKEDYPELVKSFVKKKCPAICEIFYNSIQDGLISAGLNPDIAIEMTEEILAMELDELLISLAHEVSPELLKTK